MEVGEGEKFRNEAGLGRDTIRAGSVDDRWSRLIGLEIRNGQRPDESPKQQTTTTTASFRRPMRKAHFYNIVDNDSERVPN
jgi:hypothetical protein